MTVGLVLVSHSPKLAEGLQELAAQMAPDVAIEAAGGTDEGEIGTSFDKVLAAVTEADSGDGAVLLCDLGSAQMTAELVLEVLDDEQRARVLVADAPLVEGAVAAATTAQGGSPVAEVAAAASAAWGAGSAAPAAQGVGSAASGRTAEDLARATETPVTAAPDEVRETVVLPNPLGIHARPAALIVKEVAEHDADVRLGRPGQATTDARSILSVLALGIGGGQEMEIAATGPDARQAVDALAEMARDGFGES